MGSRHIGILGVRTLFKLDLYPPNGGYSAEYPHLHDDGLHRDVVGPSNLVIGHRLLLPNVSQSSWFSWQKLSMSMLAPPVSQVNLVMRAGPHSGKFTGMKILLS